MPSQRVISSSQDQRRVPTDGHPGTAASAEEAGGTAVAFLFPGVGDQYPQMARGLYEAEPVFRAEVDRCAEILRAHLGTDVREALYPGDAPAEDGAGPARIDLRRMLGRDGAAEAGALARTELAHPAVFAVEYALARLWMERGIVPECLLGHSLGEYVAATVAGVFPLEDALALVAARARMIDALPAGAMLAVPLDPEALRPHLRDGAALAAVNAPGLCTVSGTPRAVAALEGALAAVGVTTRRLQASHAFHSAAMEPVAARLAERVRGMELRAPSIPFLSNVTGTWITAEQATDPAYWATHLTRTVRFADALHEALRTPGRVFLEVGPGRTLGTFALHAGAPEPSVLASLRHAYTRRPDTEFFAETLGRLRSTEVLRHAAHVAPGTETERAVAALWRELLPGARVAARDDFFALGGHSLLAMQVLARLREAFRVRLSLRDFFASPTVADLAAQVDAARAAGARAVPPPIPAVPRDGPLPLSFAQERLWFLETLGAAGAYNVPRRLRLRGALDRHALVRALDRIVARHEALRTTFGVVDGAPRQRVGAAEESAFRLREHDLRGAAGAAAELERLVAEEADAPFDLERGPLVRGRLVHLADDDHLLLVTMHHIVSDGWSLDVLAGELGALYAAFAAGEGDPLPPLPLQYADYAAWQRQWVAGEALAEQGAYWERALRDAPGLLELPLDRPRPARQELAGASVPVALDAELSAALAALGRRHGTSPFMTLMAAWSLVLGRLAGQEDVVVGIPAANRGRGEIEGLIGFFVNSLALRVDLSGSPTVAELLARVRARALEAQQHHDIPFEQVVERVQPVRSLAHTPVFQVMLTWEGAPPALALPGLAPAQLERCPQGTCKCDLALFLSETEGRIGGELYYATSLFDRATVERWLGYLRRVLEGMAADASRPVDRLEMLPEAERRQLVDGWNAGTALPADACVHESFERQAQRTPDAVALSVDDQALTYAELDARANRLAHHLRARGVGPEVLVALCLEPGVEMMAAVLGVLKTGGAYLPLDPAYPPDRIAYMLGDSGARVLATHSALLDGLPLEGVEAVVLDRDADRIASCPDTRPAIPDSPFPVSSRLAYVIYTSGSTGRPKGVRVEHGALAATMAAAERAFGFGAEDRAPSLASFAFDIWLFESLLPLLAGGSVRMFARDRVLEVPRLVEDLASCTVLHAVPALMRRIVQEVRATPEGVLPGLRRAFVGGDAVAPDLLEEMRAAFPAAEIHVLYGPTEAAIICAAHRLG
ncbi:MAG TPA: condensation domain-containing protein, partial [Longimicrobium sp.]|nr:condensation domain-containing protein [Longimicrobium sp.]